MTSIAVTFPGGVGVDATLKGHTVHTDQPAPLGMNSASSPFDLFLASIATCAGFYALRFCQERSLSTEGLGVLVDIRRDGGGKRIEEMAIKVHLPPGFPEKYGAAIARAVNHCAVKEAITNPPRFTIETVTLVTSPGDAPDFAKSL